MNILGISAFYHDSAAALVIDGEIIAAAQEERFSRKKHDPSFPINSLRFCLEFSGLTLDDIDAVAFYDKPFLKLERLLETYYAFAPKGLPSFVMAMPVWLKEKMFLKRLLYQELDKVGQYNKEKLKLLFPEHHLSHAASAFYPSPFQKAAILTIDGVGEWATASIGKGENGSISILKELHFPHSLGLLYSAFTYYCGFRVNSGEYKLMGLAPYGVSSSVRVEEYVKIIKEKLVCIYEDGSIYLDQEYFNYAVGLSMTHDKKWERLFGFKRREPEKPLEQHHCDLALAIQLITEEIVLKMAREAKRLTECEFLCLAGGVALNCVANGKIQNERIFKDIFIQPAAGDAGGSIGAALAAHHLYYKQNRIPPKADGMKGSYLGPEFNDLDVRKMANRFKAVYTHHENEELLVRDAARILADGHVLGWCQGRMEFGPRALGARSILGDARSPEMQKKLNLKIKFREGFRPFAPSVLNEDRADYFELTTPSPYMLLVQPVKNERRHPLPEGYSSWPINDKLYFLRSDLPSVTHVDYSARVQTVHRNTNERYWKLIDAFKKLTGYAVIVNTSFNVRGEPIVCTPEDAYRCFMRTEMDYLAIGTFLFDKKSQPEWAGDINWKSQYSLD